MGINLIPKIKKEAKRVLTQMNGLKYLAQVNEKLGELDLISFADFGTLLGIVRENGLLKNDLDVDVGVLALSDEVFAKVEQTLSGMGFHKHKEITIRGAIKKQAYRKHHVTVDIEYYFPDADSALMYCYLFYIPPDSTDYDHRKCVIKKCPRVTETEKVSIHRQTVLIPRNPEKILEYKYGTNWKIPDKGWVYWEGPNTYPTDEIGDKQQLS
ncbi:MAG: hypothetical protein K6F53_04915 [Lachnospiraceae bacterium]|nr:hypothetical protein [Lachnospiraceae bacterium]